MSKLTTGTGISLAYKSLQNLPLDDRSVVESVDDLWKKSTWAEEGEGIYLYPGIIVGTISDGDYGDSGLYYLVAEKTGAKRAAVAFKYMWSDSDNVAPGAVSGTDVSAPGKSTTMGWRKLSFGEDSQFPSDPGDYILVVDAQGNAGFVKEPSLSGMRRLVPDVTDLNTIATDGMILTVIDDGNGGLSYGWESFWLPDPPNSEDDYILRRDSNGHFAWVPVTPGAAEDTYGIYVEDIYEDGQTGEIVPTGTTPRKTILTNEGSVVAVEDGQDKFRLEIPLIDGGDAWGATSPIEPVTPDPIAVFDPGTVTISIGADGQTSPIDVLDITASDKPASIPAPESPAGAAVRYTENFNMIPGYTTSITCTNRPDTCKVLIWAGSWVDCLTCSDPYDSGTWTVAQTNNASDVIAPDLACIILTGSNNNSI